jgi:16S rRNA (guanine1516-N2)-methyltransferase
MLTKLKAQPSIGIWTQLPEATSSVEEIAKQLELPITNQADLILNKNENGWRLTSQDESMPGEIMIDFAGGKVARRRKIPGAGKQPLAKAVGIKQSQRPTILDATAGLGADAFLLASLGCKVWLCERNPIVTILLKDAIERATNNPQTAAVFKHSMSFVGSDINQAKQILSQAPDVIYLDPMYPKPTKKRSANVKKEMQIMRTLLTPDDDASEWLEIARNWSKKVVVKRPSWAKPLAEDMQGSVESKNHRYDIFMGKETRS